VAPPSVLSDTRPNIGPLSFLPFYFLFSLSSSEASIDSSKAQRVVHFLVAGGILNFKGAGPGIRLDAGVVETSGARGG